ncbi:MAG: SMP-30/gluconolactonase/LRE family protein [Candidatus Sericytochromatia bacterium]|nr:SMP-30/gluconolactonase/LRE family protein [Candidatus Sericytochromatia bacterium]
MLRLSLSLILAGTLWLGSLGSAQAGDSRVRVIENVGAMPVAATWFKQRLIYGQTAKDQLMIWDRTQSNILWSQSACQPVAVIPTKDSHFLVACQQNAALRVINGYGQVIESFENETQDNGLVDIKALAQNFSLTGIQAMVQDSRGGTYLALAGAADRNAAQARRGQIFYLSPSRKILTPVASQLDGPVALALSADGKNLYVGEHLSRQIRIFDVFETKLSNGRVFKKISDIFTASSDATEEPAPSALAFNSKGQLYIGLWGEGKILVTNPEAKLLGSIGFSQPYITSFTFGPNERTLYATTVDSPEPGSAGKLLEIRL